jgi:hypothetical protein
MATADDKPSVRLADVRVPRFWLLSVVIGVALGEVLNMRARADVAGTGKDLAAVVLDRWKANDGRDDVMIDLTQSLRRLTWALVFVGIVTLIVSTVALVVALA